MARSQVKDKRIGKATFEARCRLLCDSLDRIRKLEHLEPDADEVRTARHLYEQVAATLLRTCEQIGREGFSK